MSFFVELTAVDHKLERIWIAARRRANDATVRDVEMDEDDLEMPVERDPDAAGTPEPVTTGLPGTEPAGLYYPVTVAVDQVRQYYTRKGGKAGTRIVFIGGAAEIVKETYTEVKEAFARTLAG